MNEAFSHDLESHHAAVFRYVYRMTGDWEEAQDLTQEAFTRWAAHDRPLDGSDANRRWLFVVARNLAFSHLRKRGRIHQGSLDCSEEHHASAPSPRDVESSNETAVIVAQAISELPHDLREIVVLREYESMNYAEIAHITGAALGTVKSRLARARGILRKKLTTRLEIKS